MTREAELEKRLRYTFALCIGYMNQYEDVPKDLMDAATSFMESLPDNDETVEQVMRSTMNALSTPPSTTALQELITEVERRTIERCALECYGVDGNSFMAEQAIRALPTGNLKLEDL